MDDPQISGNSKASAKKKRRNPSGAGQGQHSGATPDQLTGQHDDVPTQPIVLASQVDSISLDEDVQCKSKPKRNRKKRSDKKITPEGVSKEEDKYNPPHTAIASISASFIPAVQEAIRLLQSNEEQMNSSAPSSSSQTPNTLSKKSKKKNKQASEIESIVTAGAKKLESNQNALSASVGKGTKEVTSSLNNIVSEVKAPLNCTLNSKELQFVFAASSLGPIYSRSSLSSPVAVTCSSSSSQLSTDRIQSSHLYGNTPHSAAEVFTASTSPAKVMSAPAVQKSKEEIEAERKARKAAKQAAKGKGKEATQEAASSPVSKREGKENEPVVSSQTSKTKEVAQETPSTKPNINAGKDDASKTSKAELRAERRAKQEAQRAAKAQQQQQQADKQKAPPSKAVLPSAKPKDSNLKGKENQSSVTKVQKQAKDIKAERRVKLFSHLYQNSYKNISQSIGVNNPRYHLAIVRLGVQYANRVVLGSNARCLALLYTLKELIADYETPPQKEFSRGLEAYLQPNMDFLQQCRPHSVSMINALRHIKWQLTQLSIDTSDAMARQQLHDAIDQYINEQIGKAAEAIGKAVSKKIADDDVILVYACSSLVLNALKVALDEKRRFRVVVVDSLPWLEGREMLRRLVSMGVQCSYVHLSAASFVMREVSIVLLGAHALLANGYVMSRAGSSQVALLAHTYNVPVLVCCETHKFSERVQTDSFVYNELGDPDELIGSRRAGEREAERERPLANWRDLPYLSLLNLVYDVTPPDLVTAVVTERAILPCTSVPVILRIKPPEC